jgi:hypothetical protein
MHRSTFLATTAAALPALALARDDTARSTRAGRIRRSLQGTVILCQVP